MSLYIDHHGTDGNDYYALVYYQDRAAGVVYVWDDSAGAWVDYLDFYSDDPSPSLNRDYGIALDQDLFRTRLFFATLELTQPPETSDTTLTLEVEVWLQSGGTPEQSADTQSACKVIAYDFSAQTEYDAGDRLSRIESVQTDIQDGILSDFEKRLIRQIHQRVQGRKP